MSAERLKKHELDPKVSSKAVQAVVADLKGDPGEYFLTLRDKRFSEQTEFREILHPEFQIFRIGILGFEIPISEEDRERYKIKEKAISTLGPDVASEKDVDEENVDIGDSINTMRAFVAGVFHEEAALQKKTKPRINLGMIDPRPVKREHIQYAVASRKGMYLYEWEELEKKWQKENPEFYEETVKLKDELKEYYSKRILRVYKNLPQEYLEKIAPEVRSEYEDYLMEYALRTYAMFTPHPPTLCEVRTKK